MNDYEGSGFFAFCVITALFIGLCLGAGGSDYIWRKSCIKHNCAQYDIKTGEWQWKDSLEKTNAE